MFQEKSVTIHDCRVIFLLFLGGRAPSELMRRKKTLSVTETKITVSRFDSRSLVEIAQAKKKTFGTKTGTAVIRLNFITNPPSAFGVLHYSPPPLPRFTRHACLRRHASVRTVIQVLNRLQSFINLWFVCRFEIGRVCR